MSLPDPPPRPPPGAIPRARLLDQLERRFDVAMTLVVGGGGAGKSTLLAQALVDEPDRVDVWTTATTSDDERLLFGRVLAGLGARATTEPDASQIAEAIVALAPKHVCIVVDDAHRLPSDAPLEEMLDHLPRNGHLLVGSRRRPALRLSRLDVGAELVEIAQADLLFTPAELVELARDRRVDVTALDAADGWPALVELACRGDHRGSGGRRYLEEEAVASLDPAKLVDLAAFAFIGGGDDTMARAVTGRPLEELLSGLPLIVGDPRTVARPHDLWLELLDQYLTPQARTAAALAAADVLADAGELDRAIEMVGRVEAHDEIEALIRRACLTVLDGGLDPGRLARWVELVPVERADRGVGHLVRGLLARERDPASSVCWAEFTSAAASFREAGDEDAEIAAIGQLGYLSLITDRLDELMGLFVRVQELVDAGCPAAEPFLAFGAAWLHLNAGEPGEQLAAVEGIADDDVPEAWRLTRDYLRANALMNLGRPDDALDVVPHELRDRAIPLPGALVLEDRLVWLAGRPEEVVRRGIPGLGPGYGARDRFLGGTFAAVVYAFAGRVDDADAAIASTRDAAGNDPGQVVDLQLQALSIVPDVARGFEDRAAATLRSLFALVPIDDPAMRTMFTPHCALPYVLLAETRRFWDGAALGPTFAMGRSLARLLVAFREEGDLGPARLLDWPAPGLLAALLPLPWLIEVTLIGARAGVPAARETGAWALEHWGAPAREILRRQADGSGDLATTAATLLTELPMPPEQKTRISVIGPMTVHYGSHATASSAWRRERVRALLLYLVLHRSSPRERVAEALWPDLPSNKADKNLRTTLSYLHQVLEPTRSAGDAPWYLRNEQGLLVLHDSVEVDLWEFDGLLDEAAAHEREGAPTRALEHYVAALKLWRGALGGGEADHEWADLERTRVQSRLVRAAGRAADLFVATGRPDEAIDTCHVAIAVDRWFEPAYQTLTRAYVELDDLSSARATMQSARAALAEIDQEHTVDPSFPSRARATERN